MILVLQVLCPLFSSLTYGAKGSEDYESFIQPPVLTVVGGSTPSLPPPGLFPDTDNGKREGEGTDHHPTNEKIHNLRENASRLRGMAAAIGKGGFALSNDLGKGMSSLSRTDSSTTVVSRNMTSIGDTFFRPIGQEIEGIVYDYVFGSSVSLSNNGEFVAIAGSVTDNTMDPVSGLVKVYQYSQPNNNRGDWIWKQYGEDIITNTAGLMPYTEVSLSGEGSVLAVASVYMNLLNRDVPLGEVTFYEYSESLWEQKGSKVLGGSTGEDLSGVKVALSRDGEYVIIGSPFYSDTSQGIGDDTGRVRVYNYKNTEGDWIQVGSDFVGSAVADKVGSSVALVIVQGILYVAFGAIGKSTTNGEDSGHVQVHRWDENMDKWAKYGGDIIGEAARDESGFSVALAYTIELKLRIAIGAVLNDGDGTKISAGHVRIYDYSSESGKWEQIGSDLDGESGVILGSGYYHTGDFFGFCVDLSEDGSRLVAGAPLNNGGTTYYGGHTRVFDFHPETNQWIQVADDIDGINSGDTTGHSVSMSADGKTFAVGGPGSTVEQSAGGVIIWQEDTVTSSPSISPSNSPSFNMKYYCQFFVVEVKSDNPEICDKKKELRNVAAPLLEDIIGNLEIEASNIIIESNCPNFRSERSLEENNTIYYFRFIGEFTQFSRDESDFKDADKLDELVNEKQSQILYRVNDETGIPAQILIHKPIEAPSASPSASGQPSHAPSSLTVGPTGTHAPSSQPTATPAPSVSSKPSGFNHRAFNIYTDSEKFDRSDFQNFCLTAKYVIASPIYVRPCNTRFKWRQTWIQTSSGHLKLLEFDFCIAVEGRQLFLRQCGPDSVSFEQLSEGSDSIVVTKPSGTFNVGFDPLKYFSRLRLYKTIEDNMSMFQWRLGFLDNDDI